LTTPNSYILFLHWQHNWHPYRHLVSCYALSCLCISVYNAFVEGVFSHATSVFRMLKSCDFECV